MSDISRRILTFLLFFAAVTFPCVVIYQAASSYQLLPQSSPILIDPSIFIANVTNNISYLATEEVSLERVLKDAAMDDGTVILTTLNEAWAAPDSIFDLFLESFRIGDHTRRLLNHLVIIALDGKAYTRCLAVHTHCFALTTEGLDFSKEAYFMSPHYLKMMWRRIDFLRSVLEMGYNFVFTDADIMWFRDPFPRFYSEADFQIACDSFWGNSYDLNNRPNGGFNYVKSNNQTIEFYKFWYSSRETHPGYHDQDVLNMIKHDPRIAEIGLTMRFLNTAYFGGLCEPSRNLNRVCTMHANCCYGLDSKLHDLRIMLEDWRKYMALPFPYKKLSFSSWRVPQKCSLASLRHYSSPPKDVHNEKEE
ncbi:Nucleotide-diphospho-sugar transferase family protein [Thalictrum thalictroides]|uniref:Glycosyltransferase n=1 Tax=Thalictrum thalictroides TaxID=46969 RepID=A0A7J6UTQ3_THATH|nr:Nucleotide-diphospho-sugar transferase family protein [Thalictrum thalictroides]